MTLRVRIATPSARNDNIKGFPDEILALLFSEELGLVIEYLPKMKRRYWLNSRNRKSRVM